MSLTTHSAHLLQKFHGFRKETVLKRKKDPQIFLVL